MTAFELLEAMGGIEEKWLAEKYDAKKSRGVFLARISAAAASLVLVTGIGIGALLSGHYTKDTAESAGEFENFGMNETAAAADMCETAAPEVGEATGTTAELPVLEFETPHGDYGGSTGYDFFGSVNATAISDLIGSNPWTKESTVTSLPVYYNHGMIYHDKSEKVLSEEEMRSILEDITGKLGIEIKKRNFRRGISSTDDYVTDLRVETDTHTVRVHCRGSVWVEKKTDFPDQPLSADTAMTYYERFGALPDFEIPTLDAITNYSVHGDPYTLHYLWDSAGDEREQILSYAFDRIFLYSNDTEYSLQFDYADSLREYLGEYPIITWQEAEEMLYAGKYIRLITTVPEQNFGIPTDYDHVELVYRLEDRYILPYYKFYVRLEEGDDCNFDGERMWGVYYVPAVSEEYLDKATFWGPSPTDPPILLYQSYADGMGFEGISAYDISEIIGTNPWSKESTPSSLPVWYNQSAVNQGGMPQMSYSDDNLLALAGAAAKKLNEKILSHEFSTMQVMTEDGFTEYTTAVTVQTERFEIRLNQNGSMSVTSETDIPENPGTAETALLIYDRFASLLDFENPTVSIITFYNFNGTPHNEVYLYDAAGDETEQILAYADRILVNCTDTWYGIHLDSWACIREFVGEYPIISLEDAADMLLNGYYITTVPETLYGIPESYDHAELVYRTNDLYIMPYYKFRVPLEEDADKHFEGKRAWGAYYVPAVSREYLDESTFWDGSFN